MGRTYDNWGKLVTAVVRREQLRQLALNPSRTPSIISSRLSSFSYSSSSLFRESLVYVSQNLDSEREMMKIRFVFLTKEVDGNVTWLEQEDLLSLFRMLHRAGVSRLTLTPDLMK